MGTAITITRITIITTITIITGMPTARPLLPCGSSGLPSKQGR